uniref:Uncharacterized protein n=1 Tax=Strigamia maritima TaxID=126957 RepID=T1J655_STRMM
MLLTRTLLKKPKVSLVLTHHLKQRNFPPWTSYFVKKSSIANDQYGRSHFNWTVNGHNYHILRTGCHPYIKYHCTKRPYQNLKTEDWLFRIIKIINLGIPSFAYGIGAMLLIRHHEDIHTPDGTVRIYFLYEEDKGAMY